MEDFLLKTVWQKIGEDYKKGLINSERCLQSALYMRFRNNLINPDKIFVEPVIDYYENNMPKFKPDLVICKNKEFTALIEIKFSPNWEPNYINDMIKINKILNQDEDKGYYAARKPITGDWEDNDYTFSFNTKYIIAAIAKKGAAIFNKEQLLNILDAKNKEKISNRFYILKGLVDVAEKTKPDFFIE